MQFQSSREKVAKELDFNTIIFRQIDRTLKSISQRDDNFVDCIEALDAVLSPYEDIKFRSELKNLVLGVKESHIQLSTMKGIPENKLDMTDKDTIAFLSFKEKFKILMRLAKRSGFIPEKEESYVEE